LAAFHIPSNRDDINTGVWVGHNKIAAVGVSSARWITTHGLAINVHPNLQHFDKDILTPCGIEGRGVTSIAGVVGGDCPTVEEVADVALRCFSDVFGINLARRESIR
jgi:lipoate-protein ligase B